MQHSTASRLFWHGLAGLGVGLAGTLATAPFAAGWSCPDRDLAWALGLVTPVLAMLPPLLASSRGLGRGGAATLTGVLAVVMGAVNAVVVWVVTQLVAGRQDFSGLGAVLLFSIPFGGIPGMGFALPLAAGTWFARARLDAPERAIGAGRGLLLTVALVGAAISALVVTTRDLVYTAWPLVLVFDGLVGALCLVVAARDAHLAFRIRALAADRSGAVELAEGAGEAPPDGLPHVLGGGSWRRRRTEVLRLDTQDPGPYRASRARTPVLSLAAPPDVALRALVTRVAVLVVCAAVLGWSATRAPTLAPTGPLVCAD